MSAMIYHNNHNHIRKIILLSASLAILFSSYFIFRLDFSKFAFQDFDIMYICSTYLLWVYIGIVVILCLSNIIIKGYFNNIIVTLTIFLLFNVLYYLAQYPYAPHWDFYYHASYPKIIINTGRVEPTCYGVYPGTFLLIALFSLILNINEIAAMWVLFSITQVLLYIVIFFFLRDLDFKLKLLVFVLIPFFGTSFISLRYFSPYFFTFTLLLTCLLLLFKYGRSNDTRTTVLLFVISTTIIISHAYNQVFLVIATLLFCYFYNKGKNPFFLMILMTATICWHIYNAICYFEFGVSYIYKNIFSNEKLLGENARGAIEVARFTSMHALAMLRRSSIITIFFTTYKWLAYTLLMFSALLAIVKRVREHSIKILAIFMLGTILANSVFLISPSLFLDRIAHTILLFDSIIIAHYLAILYKKKGSPLASESKTIKVLLITTILLLPISFVATHPPNIVYSYHPFEYSTFTHDWELHVCRFTSTFIPIKAIISSDTHTAMIYKYFAAPARWEQVHAISFGENFKNLVKKNPALFNGSIIIRSFTQEVFSYSAQDVHPNFWERVDRNLIEGYALAKVYSTKYSSVYSKAIGCL